MKNLLYLFHQESHLALEFLYCLYLQVVRWGLWGQLVQLALVGQDLLVLLVLLAQMVQ
jgi:hypothetical protein